MPKISDERRAERRLQILTAAWTCFEREGLHATTMDDIIRASGLSAGAVYSYFKAKEDLIVAALTTSLTGIGDLVRPLLHREPLPGPDALMCEVMATIAGFSERDGFDLKRVALLGWSEAQRSERLRTLMRGFYVGFRDDLAAAVRSWQRAGVLDPAAEPHAVAATLLSVALGYVVQAAILGDVAPETIAAGLRDLEFGRSQPGPAAPTGMPASRN